MKTLISILAALVISAMISCEKTSDYSKPLGGSTDLAANKVGFQYTGSLTIGTSGSTTDAMAKVLKNEGGVIEVQGTGTIPQQFRSLVNSPYVNSKGVIELTGKFVNSTEGVAYINADGEQSILAKFDAKVGDKWSYTTKGGKNIVREVKSISTDDDFYWGGMMIKVIAIEQNLPYPGFTKAVYRANHKFGLVQVEVFLEDGTSASLSF